MADGGYILSRNEQMIRAIIDGTSYSTGYIQSRNEKILQAIIDGTSYDAEPQSRIEALLLHILNGTTTDVVPLSRNEAILTAIANGTEYTEEPQSRMEALLIEWLESRQAVEKTASGAVASFTTALAEPLIKCICAFMATQELNGQSAPYPAGGGKNKANFVNGYGISISGEVEANLARFATVEAIPIKSGETYYVKKMQSGACSFIVAVYNGSTLVSRVSGLNSGDTIDTTGGDSFRVAGYASGSSVTFEAVEAMVVTDNTVTAYAPYENICPIVPVSSVDVTRTGKNLFRGYGEKTYIKPNVNYYLSSGNIEDGKRIRFLFYDKDNNQITPVRTSETTQMYVNASGYLVLSSDATYLHFIVGVTNSDAYYCIAIDDSATAFHYPNYPNIQIEVGLTATAYEAYNGVSDNVALGASYYGGNVDVVDGKIENKCVVVTCIGSEDESWSIVNQGETNQRFRLNPAFSGYTEIASTHFSKISSNTGEWGHYRLANGYLVLTDNNNVIGSVANLKTWLANENTNGRPVQFMFELATPTEATTSDTATLNTLQGQNNVFNNTGNTEVTYLDKP